MEIYQKIEFRLRNDRTASEWNGVANEIAMFFLSLVHFLPSPT